MCWGYHVDGCDFNFICDLCRTHWLPSLLPTLSSLGVAMSSPCLGGCGRLAHSRPWLLEANHKGWCCGACHLKVLAGGKGPSHGRRCEDRLLGDGHPPSAQSQHHMEVEVLQQAAQDFAESQESAQSSTRSKPQEVSDDGWGLPPSSMTKASSVRARAASAGRRVVQRCDPPWCTSAPAPSNPVPAGETLPVPAPAPTVRHSPGAPPPPPPLPKPPPRRSSGRTLKGHFMPLAPPVAPFGFREVEEVD